MIEPVRKLGLFGIGVISLTKEKLEEAVKDLEKRGEISAEEGKKLVREVWESREKELKELEEKINLRVKENIKKTGILMKEDIEKLEKKIAQLEKSVEKLSKK
jgi:polyhydroxyalkanoate synthesis regulator phasin